MKSPSGSMLALCYIAALVFGCIIAGFWLTAFGAGTTLWVLSGLTVVYLSATGEGGIVLSNTWLAIAVTMFALRPWPTISIPGLPIGSAPLWALSLILLWFLSISLVFLLAEVADFLIMEQGWGKRKRMLYLGSLAWLSLGLGSLIFPVLQNFIID